MTDEETKLRDKFAGQALQSIILATAQGLHRKGIPADVDGLELGMAQDAYKVADAMLEARGGAPRLGDAVAAALHFASENAELKTLLKDLREELREENQNPFKMGDLLDRAAKFLGKEGE
jgi:hypothetical protein